MPDKVYGNGGGLCTTVKRLNSEFLEISRSIDYVGLVVQGIVSVKEAAVKTMSEPTVRKCNTVKLQKRIQKGHFLVFWK